VALYAFDGTKDDDRETGSSWEAVAADTNIYRFYSAYTGNCQALDVNTEYVPGVGTRFGLAGRIAGGTWGVGWLARVNETYDARCQNYGNGHTDVDVIGVTRRGAIGSQAPRRVYDRGASIVGDRLLGEVRPWAGDSLAAVIATAIADRLRRDLRALLTEV